MVMGEVYEWLMRSFYLLLTIRPKGKILYSQYFEWNKTKILRMVSEDAKRVSEDARVSEEERDLVGVDDGG